MTEEIISDGTYNNTDGTASVEVTNGASNNSQVTIDMLKEGLKAGTWSKSSDGGRRHRGSKKAHKKSHKGNKMLSSWVAFVKKVQREEKIPYSKAMKRASTRKKEWKRGQMGGDGPMGNDMSSVDGDESDDLNDADNSELLGGRRRRRGTKRRGSRRRHGSRKRR